MTAFLTILFNGLAYGSLLFIMSIGLAVTMGMMRFVNLAHVSLCMLGGYITVVAMGSWQWPFGWALLAAFVGSGIFSIVLERLVLRHLVNQEATTLLMATLGITYFLEGLGQSLFGSDIYKIDIGMPKEPVMAFESVFEGGILINQEDLIAALIAALLVALLSLFFQKTSTGRALRAVADDHQAAQSIGIPLNRIWVIVWCVAGVVALVAGMIWGSKLGVQFSLATVALRALPVVILGGLTSVPGAIIGGLIIGVGEKLSEVFLGPYVGGGIEIWFAYVLALLFLLVRPQGLFGEKIIDRV